MRWRQILPLGFHQVEHGQHFNGAIRCRELAGSKLLGTWFASGRKRALDSPVHLLTSLQPGGQFALRSLLLARQGYVPSVCLFDPDKGRFERTAATRMAVA